MPEVTLNGVKHYYDDQGSGEALIMLHGAMGSAHNFEAHGRILSDRFRVIAVDMRGMGRSEHVTEMPSAAWTDDLLALMDHLGIQKAHIFGTSLGSRLCMRVGIFHPERASSLILNSPHIFLTPALDEAQNRAGGDGNALPAPRQADLRNRHGEDWLDVVRNYFNIRNVSELQEFYNFQSNLDQITCPVLTISTDNPGDTFDHALEIKQRISGARLAIMPSFASDAASGYPQTSVEAICEVVASFAGSLTPAAVAS